MQRITLHFDSLTGLTTFSQMVLGGFVIDTKSLTISGNFPTPHIIIAKQVYDAKVM